MVGTPRSPAGNKTWVIVALVVGGLLFVFVVGVSLVAFGAKRYLASTRAPEGRTLAMELASGVARCGSANGLPESTRPVPAALADVRGTSYRSQPSDWSDPTFRCAGFSRTSPQYFQYQWARLDAAHGVVTARADLDGNGVIETGYDVAVSCSAGVCMPAASVTDMATKTSVGSAGGSSRKGPTPEIPLGYKVVSVLAWLAMLAAAIWTLVLAFSDSILWGFLVLCVPCASLVFTIKNWEKARTPFFISLGAFVVLMGATLVVAVRNPDAFASSPAEKTAPDAPAPPAAPPPPPRTAPSGAPQPAEFAAEPKLDGANASPNEVLIEAQLRATKWDYAADLVGIEIVGVSKAKVDTSEGGFVSASYRRAAGRSRTSNDQLLVIYDKAGMREQESRSSAPLPTLPRPGCSPDRVAEISESLSKSPTRLNLKYLRDAKRERFVWLSTIQSSKEPTRTFDGQSCAILVH
jgi:hypothetical protein